jgi:uncharacterized protein (TIGR02246 family)
MRFRIAVCGCALVVVSLAPPPDLTAQSGAAAAPLNWSADDSARIAFLSVSGYRIERTNVVLWAPRDSIDEGWMRALADTLDRGVAGMRRLMKAPYTWQRIGSRPVTYYISPGRFISHGTGYYAVFIPVSRVKERLAPLLHEAAHELLAPKPPFYYGEFADTLLGARVSDNTPLWLFEGLPDYLAHTVAPAVGLHEGDVFEVGGLSRADSSCAARVKGSPRGREIIDAVGRGARPEALFTAQRQQVAPIFYACGQALTRHLVEHLGVRQTVELMPAMARGDWAAQIARRGGVSMELLRARWLNRIGLAVPDSSRDLKAWRAILDDLQRAFMERNASLFTTHFAADGDFMQAFGRYRATRNATEDFMEWFLGGQSAAFVSRETGNRIRRVTPDVAFVEAEFEGEGIRNGDGTMQPPRRGQMMLVLRRRSGEWKVVSYRYLDIHAATLR